MSSSVDPGIVAAMGHSLIPNVVLPRRIVVGLVTAAIGVALLGFAGPVHATDRRGELLASIDHAYRERQLPLAERLVGEALAELPDDVDLLQWRGRIEVGLANAKGAAGAISAAQSLYRRAIETYARVETLSPEALKPSSRHAWAFALFSTGRYSEAASILERALTGDPERDASIHGLRANCALRL
ncbi:MAG: hypothetical protein KDC38_14840, partial [Planctomycetes bacterium]|nr:hypothetical protein [Planctomycetota bacterium]